MVQILVFGHLNGLAVLHHKPRANVDVVRVVESGGHNLEPQFKIVALFGHKGDAGHALLQLAQTALAHVAAFGQNNQFLTAFEHAHGFFKRRIVVLQLLHAVADAVKRQYL